MEIVMKLTNSLGYLWMIFFIMIIAGLAKEYNLFAPAYAYIKNTFRSNKFVVVILSAIGGILPIEGRVTVSAGLLDTVAPKNGPGREKMGIVDYLATHHYYMWSPLEKTVIVPIAAFGMTYVAFVETIAPLLIVSLAFIGGYIWSQIREEEVAVIPGKFSIGAVLRNVLPMATAIGAYIWVGGESNVFIIFGLLTLYYVLITQQWNIRKLLKYINWEVLITVAVVIVIGNYFKLYAGEFQSFIQTSGLDPSTFIGMLLISVIGFSFSFLMGSSSKFIALAVLMTQVFGLQYFLWFFACEYAGYLLSPTHKCVMIGNRYFGTSFRTYYTAIGAWTALLFLSAGVFVFLF